MLNCPPSSLDSDHMKSLYALSLSLFAGSLIFAGCATTEGPTTSANMPPSAGGEASSVETTTTTVETTSTTVEPLKDDGSDKIVPLLEMPKDKKGYPYAIKTKWPGLVKSPYAQTKTLVDVSSMASGSHARCPHTWKIFTVP